MSIIEANNIFIGDLENYCQNNNTSLVIENGVVTKILCEGSNVETA